MDDAVISSALARDAAVAIARMRTAELYRQHASEPAQASYFAMQVTASSNALKAKLRDIAEHAISVPSRQAFDRVTATFSALSDHRPPSLSTGAVFAKGIESEHGTAILEEKVEALWRSIDADITGAKAAIGTRIWRLELLQFSTTLFVVLLAIAGWAIARRLGEVREAGRDSATAAEWNEFSGGATFAEWLEGSLGAACEGTESFPRAPEGRVARALEGASDGVILIDGDDRITFANARAMSLDGFVEILRASRPESVNGESESEVRLADGRWLRVSRSIAPDGRILALCGDVSVDKERLLQLRADNRTLRTALDCMSQGLCLFDSAHRLIVVNRRYSAIYGLDPNLVHRGMTSQELIGLSGAAGNHPGQNLAELQEEARQAFQLGEPGPVIQKLGDGRVVQIQMRPTADGGFVAHTRTCPTAGMPRRASLIWPGTIP